MIDSHAPTFDVSSSHVVAVDAKPAAVLAALDHLGLARSVARTIALFGATQRFALEPSSLEPATGAERVYGLAWSVDRPAAPVPAAELRALDAPGYIKVIWDVRVSGDAEIGTYVSTTTRFVATDATARHRLLSAWRVLGPMSADLARRGLASIKRAAEGAREPIVYGAVSGFPAVGPPTALPRAA
jgi:hypothetical protein